ncbi:hypothetical protein GQ42DRAFT_142736 [Ramicandelaber brevisporus]|nr:hypothetical protein GQ42DRAFT_142736 [Ramicandelaber brevisporus]
MSDALRKNTPSNSNSNRYSSSGGNKESDSNPWLASVDYALESSGGRIVDKYTSSTYAVPPTPSTWFGSFVNVMTSHFGFPLGTLFGNPPSIVIQPDVAPGLCWPIHGSNGQVTLKFAQSVVLEAFTVHHAYPANISPESASTVAQSAIKDIEVHGIVDALEQLKIAPLPKDVAKDHKLPPYFPIASLQIRILSNHGNEKYTCMYRFRAHGKPAPAIQFDTDGNPSKASKASKAPKHAAL